MTIAQNEGREYIPVKVSSFELHKAIEDHLAVSDSPPPSLGTEIESELPSLFSVMRSLLWTVYIPTLLLSFGDSLTFPTLPIYAQSLALEGVLLGVCLSGASFGRISTNMLSGFVLSSCGTRFAFVLSFSVSTLGAAIRFFSVGFWSLALGLFLGGFGFSLEAVARMSFCRQIVANRYRGRVVALLGGTTRIGAIIGPALGGFVAHTYGLRLPFGLQVGTYFCGVVLCALAFPRESSEGSSSEKIPSNSHADIERQTYRSVWKEYKKSLVLIGVGMFAVMFLREARIILVPLCGNELDMTNEKIGLAVSCSYVVDSFLFPFVGCISDKYGRKRTGVPAFVLLSFGGLGLTMVNSFSGLLLISIMLGFGNGLSSGLVMTTGSDVAPAPPAAGLFLGLYGGFYDSGSFLCPLLVGLMLYAANFRVAGIAVSCVGLLGTFWYICLVPETRAAAGIEQRDMQKKGASKVPDTVESTPIALEAEIGRVFEETED